MLVEIVNRCLEKEPVRRFQSASDLAFDLELLRDPTTTGRGTLPKFRSSLTRRKALWAAAAVSLLLLVAIGLSRSVRRTPVAANAVPSEVEQITNSWGWVGVSRFMPDGRIALSAAFEDAPEQVFTRPAGMSAMQPLGLGPARLASVSRTGEVAVLLKPAIGTQALRRGTLARLPNVGGAPREVAEDAEFADWSPPGELALVVAGEGEHRLESPPGKVLFRTGG